jgi:hypothetical protein
MNIMFAAGTAKVHNSVLLQRGENDYDEATAALAPHLKEIVGMGDSVYFSVGAKGDHLTPISTDIQFVDRHGDKVQDNFPLAVHLQSGKEVMSITDYVNAAVEHLRSLVSRLGVDDSGPI